MKVQLIYPDFLSKILDWKGHFYVGLGSLSATMKRAGHDTSLIHITNSHYTKQDFLRDISKSNPDLIGFSSTTIVFPFVKRILQWMEEEGIDTPTICGGVHPTVASEDAMSPKRMDMICIGEGEETILELLDRMKTGDPSRDMPGLWYKREGDRKIIRGPLRPNIEDLDSLPDPDRDLFDMESCYWERQGILVVMASRGCPYPCTYCVNHTLMDMFGAKDFVRYRSVDRVINEINTARERWPHINGCFFDDDILFIKLPWSEEFAERYAKECNLPYRCNVRPRLLDERRAALLKKSNCASVKIGVESGNDFIRNQVLKRGLKHEDMLESFEVCHKYGFEIVSFNMVGLPFETPQTCLETVKMNAEGNVHEMQVSIFYPFPATESYEICRKNGWLAGEAKYVEDYFTDSVLNLPTIEREHIVFFRNNFKRLVRTYRLIWKLPTGIREPVERLFEQTVTRPEIRYVYDIAGTAWAGIKKGIQTIRPAKPVLEGAAGPVLKGHTPTTSPMQFH
ncbi:MAG: radical SAM protein [Myxococcales bacterium]|nr:radical SAM protein [Myxococcales bacterium]